MAEDLYIDLNGELRTGDIEVCRRLVDVTGLEPDAIRVVEHIVARLRLGQATYGPLDLKTNPRDWKKEASEEFLDGAIYLAFEAVKGQG